MVAEIKLQQVAEQQGRYLARVLNEEAKAGAQPYTPPSFTYRHLGSMATVGGTSAVLELGEAGKGPTLSLRGFTSWLAWRSAYLTRLGTWRQRLFVAANWVSTIVWGRDLSRW